MALAQRNIDVDRHNADRLELLQMQTHRGPFTTHRLEDGAHPRGGVPGQKVPDQNVQTMPQHLLRLRNPIGQRLHGMNDPGHASIIQRQAPHRCVTVCLLPVEWSSHRRTSAIDLAVHGIARSRVAVYCSVGGRVGVR